MLKFPYVSERSRNRNETREKGREAKITVIFAKPSTNPKLGSRTEASTVPYHSLPKMPSINHHGLDGAPTAPEVAQEL